jgi:hypothetical protein
MVINRNEMCLNKTYSKVCIGKHLALMCPIQNSVKPGDALSSLLFNFAKDMVLERYRKTTWD